MKKFVYYFFLLFSTNLFAQIPNLGVEINLNLNTIKNTINAERASDSFVLNLPMPDGSFQRFNVRNSNIMANQPADIQTIAGTSADFLAKVRIAITSNGLSGIMHYGNAYYIIEVVDKKEGIYTIYNLNDSGLGNCGTNDADNKPLVNSQGKVLSTGLFPVGDQLRKYRFAGAATGEMVDSLGSTTSAKNKIVEIMNATNLIYELEAAVSFEVITKTTDLTLMFSDGNTDPFSVNTSFGSANDAQNGFNAMANGAGGHAYSGILPYADYDMGHTFHVFSSGGGARGTGGGSPCRDGYESKGWTEFGQNTSLGTIVGLFAHEVGHQFSMLHTYNATGGSSFNTTFCTDGWSNTASVEPGSGTTIMGYGGNCSNDSNGSLSSYVLTSPNNETYFNAKSLDQMFTKMAGVSNCFDSTSTGNSAPVVSVGAAATIPKGTPFTLTGSATDANTAVNLLSYNWSQIDVAAINDQGALGSINGIGGYAAVNSTTAPLFRSRIGSSSSRTFPALNFILNNANNPSDNEGEDLPQVARTMNFRLTVRDNATGGGGVDSDLRVITVADSGPFQVTVGNGPTLWFQGESKTITWDVNGTNAAPVSCTNVNILISTDGGTTFTSLVANTTNDGTEAITVPSTPSANVRIKLEAVGNIFFDINNSDITISNGSCTPEASELADVTAVSETFGSSNLNLNLLAVGSAISSMSGIIDGNDGTTNLTLRNGTSNNACMYFSSKSPQYELQTFIAAASATVTFTSSGSLGSRIMNLYENSYDNAYNCGNWLTSSGLYNGSGVVINDATISNALIGGTTYIIKMSGFDPGNTGTYTITPSGGTVYNPVPSSGSPYAYTFMIYNTGTSEVAGFSSTGDLRTYNAGSYAVYGMSYGGGLDLSPYVGQSLAAVQASISNGTLCATLSSNNKPVTINPCPSTPSPPSSNDVAIFTGETATLSATNCAYQIKWFQTASSFSVLGTGASFVTPSLSSTTSYFVSCTDVCESSRTEVIVTVSNNYCALALDCSQDFISNVTLTSGAIEILNQNSVCTAPGYTFYSASPTTLTQGETYNISISKSTQWSDAISGWIDFNKDLTFQESEVVFNFGINRTATQNVNFTVPTGAEIGSLRMRIKVQDNASVVDPCAADNNSEGYGEVEDYLIYIIANPCSSIAAPTVNSPTIEYNTTATLTASGCGGTVNWFTAASGGSSISSSNPFTTPNLTASTTYYADCNVNGCLSASRGSGVVTVNPDPCATSLTLVSGDNDVTSGTKIYQTSNTTGSGLISANNNISGGNTTYDAGKKVELNPGFSVISTLQNPVVFKAQIGGCN